MCQTKTAGIPQLFRSDISQEVLHSLGTGTIVPQRLIPEGPPRLKNYYGTTETLGTFLTRVLWRRQSGLSQRRAHAGIWRLQRPRR